MKVWQLLILSLLTLAAPAVAQQTEAKLKPLQQIVVRISGVPADDVQQISQTYRIGEDGTIPMVYIDRIRAVGLSPSELAKRIEQSYVSSQIFTRPTIVVSTMDDQVPDRRVTVAGEVRAPVRAVFQDGMTLLDAITQGGGFTEFAKIKDVRLIRNGQTTIHDCSRFSREPERDIQLLPDDRIIVPHR